jgi:hypothetical protein
MIGIEGVLIKFTKGVTTLVFNQSLNIKGGFLSGIKVIPVLNQMVKISVETKKMIKTMPVEINKLHKILGHCGETHLKATSNTYGIKVF